MQTLNLLLLFLVLLDDLQSEGFQLVVLLFKFAPVILFRSETRFPLQ